MRNRARLPLDSLAPYCFDPPAPAGESSSTTIDWTSVFDRDQPIEIEVGFGKGAFLISAAEANPAHNFLGIEVMRGLQLYVATRIAKRSLPNVKVACTDARMFFRDRVSPNSLHAVHVYFPDPWWKSRHKKRRVFTADLAANVERTLKPEGRLLIATDVEEYFTLMTELVAERAGLAQVARRVEEGVPEHIDGLTNFERKARLKGGKVWRAEYQKIM